ncbi:helix-turn-helix domain-containing protein [Actinophytocola xanthii]|uniref:helix-turn-helix domain-containing protein n=1 Tax=Actinophytocola xanthii TaxID=1912961 RepID=UPI0013010A34|nr:helix-turn-helix transcriptional regulator [Actinophytocola xanthii]
MRELGEELRNHRQAAGLSGQQLADRLGWSASKVSRIENGILGVTEVDLVRYVAYCGLPSKEVDRLLELHREPGTSGYWLSERSSALIFHETTATSSTSYDPLLVPGLLQTEEYAAALIGDDRPELVRLRMERQSVLRNRPFEFFVHEQALRLPVGGNRVMNDQLLKLVLASEHPLIAIRVVPGVLGACSALGGEFVLFRYEGHRPLVYLDHGVLGVFLEHESHVAKFYETIVDISHRALSWGQSRDMLAAMANRFDRPEVPPDASHLAKEQLQFRA